MVLAGVMLICLGLHKGKVSAPTLKACICLSSGCLLGAVTKTTKQWRDFLHSVGSPDLWIRAGSSACLFPLYFIIKLSICENFPLKSTSTPYEDKQLWRLVTWQMAEMAYHFLFGYVTQTTQECYESSRLSSLSLLWGEPTKAWIILSRSLCCHTQEMWAARKSLWQLCVLKRPNVRSHVSLYRLLFHSVYSVIVECMQHRISIVLRAILEIRDGQSFCLKGHILLMWFINCSLLFKLPYW